MEKRHSITYALKEDLPQIAEINNHAIEHTTANFDWEKHSLDHYEKWMKEKDEMRCPVLVAKAGRHILGFATYGQFRGKKGYLHCMEHSVYVQAEAQGKGIGSALLKALIAEAKTNDIHVLVAGIDSSNFKSIQFHKGFGFQVVGEMPQVGRKFNRWLDLTFLQLNLNN